MLTYYASLNSDVARVFDNAPRNASYSIPKVHKHIIRVLAMKVKKFIGDEIGKSEREQMPLVFGFVDRHGCAQESFLGLLHVKDIAGRTLKNVIFSTLSRFIYTV